MAKPSQGMKGRFKSLFARKSPNNSSNSTEEKDGMEYCFQSHVLKEISKENTVSHRARHLKELNEIVTSQELEDHAIEAVWKTIQDLLTPVAPTEGRQAALQFLISLTIGQYDKLGMIRSQFFRLIVNHEVEEDLQYRITLLKWLTDNGKDISYFEQQGDFLVSFMSDALFSENADEFLQLLVNMVHFNSSFLDEDVICDIVRKTCVFCNTANNEKEIESCLSLLDATVKYGALPTDGLFPLISTLCHTVNIEKFCQPSWKLMRSLVGTKLGHTSMYIVCCILENNENTSDLILMRGAVFFVSMCIWGSQRVTSLRYSPLHVLPAFKICLQCSHCLVAHEISLSLERLVKKFGADQGIITWDIVMDIIAILLKLLESRCSEVDSLFKSVHTLLANIEVLYVNYKFHGSAKRFFSLVESCSKDRSVSSISILLSFYQDQITPHHDNWLEVFEKVLEKYFKNEKRTPIRVKVVEMIAAIFTRYKYFHEDELLQLILPHYIMGIGDDEDEEIRLVVSKLLSKLLQLCSCSKYPEVLVVIEAFLSSITQQRQQITDLQIVVDALIVTFKEKLLSPSNIYIVNIFNILVNHVTLHYLSSIWHVDGGAIRSRIFSAVLSMRANQRHFIGLADADGKVKYSAHAIFKAECEELTGHGQMWLVHCDFQRAFDAELKCLKNELDWNVLENVLKNLPNQLQNKSLFIYCQCNMNKMCAALCNLVNDRTYLNKVQNCPANLGVSELRNLIFPILSVVATFHEHLSRERQLDLVKCLEFGLNTYCARTCVSCITICTLEMKSVMMRTLPSILVRLSQISATVSMAVPILQLLSTLKEIPMLYANFVEDQYMSVFAMALPYTDPFKYSTYIVTLAHQVIADWFTRCRLAFRKGFVTLITKALKSNSLVSSIDGKKDDSCAKKCSLHEDMTDVCLDMMARYSFSYHLCPPKRSPVVEYLLSKGDSQTWLLGNAVITITTSLSSKEKCQECSTRNYKMKTFDSARLKKKTSRSKLESSTDCKAEKLSVNAEAFHTAPHVPSEPIPVVMAAPCDQQDDGKESSCEEEGTEIEPTPLVEKLTQQIVDQMDNVFSPSEQLLFSRQASKICMTEADDQEDDAVYEEEDDEHLQINEVCEENAFSSTVMPSASYDIISESSFPIDSVSSKKEEVAISSSACNCLTEGWAEISIRRPTGTISWVMKIENKDNLSANTLSELSLLASELEGTELNSRIGNVAKGQRSTHVRRYSTGSIDTIRSRNSHSDEGSFNLNENLQEFSKRLGKSPLIKSLSSPKSTTPNSSLDSSRTNQNFQSRMRAYSAREPCNKDTNGDRQNDERRFSNGISPYFVFLQLFYSPWGCFPDKEPILLDHSEAIERAIRILDRIPAFNTHKFGVLYVARGQESSEIQILSNEFGSTRYTDFISGLGDLVKLCECPNNNVFTGGMDGSGADGKYTYAWKDDTTQVIFHVATLMPNKERDVMCISKKMHIGNDYVTIIYDDSKHGYNFGTIKGQMNMAEIVVCPLENNSNMVTVHIKDNCDGGAMDNRPYVISDHHLPVLVRQLAIHANIATVTVQSEKKTTNAFASNWLERLLQIKRLKLKVVASKEQTRYHDFVRYT